MPRSVVVLGSTRWDQRVPLGDWQLARAFTRLGHDVVWLDPPRSLAGRVRRFPTAAPPGASADGMVRALPTWALSGSRRWTLEGVQDLMYERQAVAAAREALPSPLVLVATPVHGPLRRVSADHQLVYWQKDRQWAQPHLPRAGWLRHRHEALLHSADVVSAVSPEIVADNLQLGVRSQLIENGVDVTHWSTPAPEPADMVPIPRPRAVFVGAWGWRVDLPLVRAIAARLPWLHMVVVGKADPGTVELPNVRFLGPRPYAALPAYAQHADVGLVPYLQATFNAASNPLKLYEYTAAGLPSVVQGVGVPAGLPHVRQVTGIEAWTAALTGSLATTLAERQALTASAASHDWEQRAQRLLECADAASGPAGAEDRGGRTASE